MFSFFDLRNKEMELKKIIATAAAIVATSTFAAHDVDNKGGEANCSKNGKNAKEVGKHRKSSKSSTKEANCSKKDSATPDANCSKKGGMSPDANCSKKDGAAGAN